MPTSADDQQQRQLPCMGAPLLQLPATAQQTVVACLSLVDRKALRLVCTAMARYIAEGVRELALNHAALLSCTRPLAQHFPYLTQLSVDAWSDALEGPDAQHTMMQIDCGVTVGFSMQLSSVICLKLYSLTPAAAAHVFEACTNAKECSLESMWGYDDFGSHVHGQYQPPLATLVHIGALKQLRSLQLSSHHYLGNSELMLLARLTTQLADLEAPLAPLSSSGWAALLSMTGLTRLVVESSHSVEHALQRLPAGMHIDMRPLCNLVHLALGSHYDQGAHPDLAEDACIRNSYGGLIPPLSVTSMRLQHMCAASAAMPNLTELQLVSGEVRDADLASLAAACPVLEQLQLCRLELTTTSNAAPLTALKALVVESSIFVAAGTSIAHAFPILKALDLNCVCDIEAPHFFFANASNLQALDVARAANDEDSLTGLHISDLTFTCLSRLPSLSYLRVNAQPQHVVGVHLLSHLTSVAFICEVQHASPALSAAFAASTAPESLRNAFFWHKGYYPQTGDEDLFVHPFVRVADAAIEWCVRAPALTTIEWHWEDLAACACAAMTRVRLWALCASSTIRQVFINECSEAAVSVAPSLLAIDDWLWDDRGIAMIVSRGGVPVH